MVLVHPRRGPTPPRRPFVVLKCHVCTHLPAPFHLYALPHLEQFKCSERQSANILISPKLKIIVFSRRNRGPRSGMRTLRFQHSQTNSSPCLAEAFGMWAPTHPRAESWSLANAARSPSSHRAERSACSPGSNQCFWQQPRPAASDLSTPRNTPCF